MEIGDKFKHCTLTCYYFEITGFCANGSVKGVETVINSRGKSKSKKCSYPKSYFNNNFNGWIKLNV